MEAAASIIYAAPHVESKGAFHLLSFAQTNDVNDTSDLQILRDILVQRLGADFARASVGNHDNYVSRRVCFASYDSP